MSKIYVIDDSISVCFAIERTLRARGHEVVTERSGRAALGSLRSVQPDLVICDVLLPDVDGRKICEHIRRDGVLSATPVVAISGLVDSHVEATALGAGANRVLKKPFSPEELTAAVDSELGKPPAPPVLQGAQPAPADPGDSPSELLVEAMSSLPSLRFGLVVSIDGRVIEQCGEQQAAVEEVVRPLVGIVRRSAVVAEWLGQTDPHQLIFQADDGLVIAQRYGDQLAVAALADASVLGKARFAFARLRRKLAERIRRPS